jgi:uncharacterized protein YkwD
MRMPVFVLIGVFGLGTPAPVRAQSTDESQSETIKNEGAKRTAPVSKTERVSAAIVEKTNEFRDAQGLAPVERNKELSEAAQYFAEFMAKSGQYGHSADGNRPAERASKFGYEYCIVLENIAYQYNSAGFEEGELGAKFFEGWKESPGHRKNMLDVDVTQTGVAVAQSSDTGYYYAVQMFGRPKSQAIEFAVANQADNAVSYRIESRISSCRRATRGRTRAAVPAK